MTNLQLQIAEHISRATGARFIPTANLPAAGGSINSTSILEGGGRRFFLKLNLAGRMPMFEAEAAGLRELARSGTIRVPEPLCWGETRENAYLVLEYLDLGPGNGHTAERLGTALADLHRFHHSEFGWFRDNTIGTTPQINTPTHDWAEFWRERRLGYQLQLAAARGYGGALQRDGDRLLDLLPVLFADHKPAPALLHGDLWSGNFAADRNSEPVIFDPAVYFGDREADLAMTELFGGFPQRFYQAYRESLPLDHGYATRKTLYNLYHVLNHLNLFGGSYLAQAEGMLALILSDLR
ncbi:MAG: fructosamine kinase family protein, partial [Acidiferrobacterales bacterium]